MKLADIKDKIDAYFDNIDSEEFFKTLIKYHMRTQFKGTINGKEFTRVQDYNAEMQRLIAAGEPINAHTDTQTIEEPQNDNSFLFPGFAHCTSVSDLNADFIDAALELEPDQFVADVNKLLHERIIPTINGKLPTEALEKYKELVAGILRYLEGLAQDSDRRAEQTVARLQAIEKELEDLKTEAELESDRKAIIDFVTNLYTNIDEAITARGMVAEVPQPIDNPNGDLVGEPGPVGCTAGDAYIANIQAKARALFGL